MNTKRAVFTAVIVVAVVAAIVPPLWGMRVNASEHRASPAAFAKSSDGRIGSPTAHSQEVVTAETPVGSSVQAGSAQGRISPDVLKSLGIQRLPKGVLSQRDVAAKLSEKDNRRKC